MPLKDSKHRWGPEHTNSNVIAAMDVRVGGVSPDSSDILEVCIVPLNHSYKISREFKPFHLRMRPVWPVDGKIAKIRKNDPDYYEAPHDSVQGFTLFENWVRDTLELKFNKRIMPLVWNWPAMAPHLKMWMGSTHYAEYIDSNVVRDLVSVQSFINDRSGFWNDEVKYKLPTFGQLLTRNGLKMLDKNSCPAKCKAIADIYHQLLRNYISGYSPKPTPPS